ncbi:unnamed protein product [Caretta caretta]
MNRLLTERRLPQSPDWLHGEQFQSIARGLRDNPKEDVPPETHQNPENSSHQPPHLPHSRGLGPFRVRQGDDRTAPLNSANFTASLGPGMDSDFGASAALPWL